MPDFETCKTRMEELAIWASAHSSLLDRNESDTRLQVIDRLLFECLGWSRDECKTESMYEGKYTDYSLGLPGTLAILEAKREGVYFELPAGFQKRIAKISTLLESGTGIESAIQQVADYCRQRSVGIAAVCNGHQLIAFLGSRQDSVPTLEGYALVFSSTEEMRSDFRILWQNLSKPGVIGRTLQSTLKGDSVPPPPQKLSQRISNYPGFKDRNPFQTELQILGDIFLEDVTKHEELEPDFLRECYCTSGALSQYALISKQILQTRYSSVLQSDLQLGSLEPVATKSGPSENLAADVFAASVSSRPIVLLGDVGVGKTIFIRHLINVDAKELLNDAVVLYVDFGKEPALATDLQDFVVRRCASQLMTDYDIDIDADSFVRGVYHGELLRFEKGIFGPLKSLDPGTYLKQEIEFLGTKVKERAAHLRSCLLHITKGHKRQVVLILDNIDQRPFEFQEHVYLIGQSLAQTWPVTVFISLRPDTFARSRVAGSLTAYQPRVFTVAPPRIDLVINKRLKFALEQLGAHGRLKGWPTGFTVRSKNLLDYLHILLESFETSDELVEFIDNLSGGNVREALGFISDFVGSGHVDAQKIMDIYAEDQHYIIPVHEFLRAVLYKDSEYYDPAASRIANIFDIGSPDGREHFLVANLLGFIERSGASVAEEGYVDSASIFAFGQALGFSVLQIREALGRALAKKLLESNAAKTGEELPTNFRITTIGAYTIHKLVSMFAYVDAMVVDTPITDPAFSEQIRDVQDIEDRLDRADIFRPYLDQQWGALVGKSVATDWPSASSSLSDDVQRIRRKIQSIRQGKGPRYRKKK